MKGIVNMANVQEQGSYVLPPEGVYEVEIVEVVDKTSFNGDPLISIKLMITEGEYQNKAWIWDNILIPSSNSSAAKILGRTKHFLHCIGEPYEGQEVEWDSNNWIYKPCRIRIAHEAPNEYHKRAKVVISEYILNEEQQSPEEGPF
ncbi:MAG: hypothetical protein DRP74_02155 [Candidatus Omnitrophota bacterium]|nr:MAG: hypothetical protein DRP74_02155 [Candidatus Omnitrophota bacterium]